jgi:hypothetical protein
MNTKSTKTKSTLRRSIENQRSKNTRGPRAAVLSLAALSFVIVFVVPGLRADDGSGDANGGTARAVRLSSVDGKVQLYRDNQTITDSAVVNSPLFEGTQVVTADDGRAEIEFEDGSVARLSPNSSLTLTVLRPDDGSGGTEIRMDGGLGYFELQSASQPGHIEVRFGDSVATASGFTVLRIDLDNPPGELAVFSGNAHLERGNALSLDLHGGESVALNAGNPSQYNLAESIEPDSWDTWNSDRDQVLNSEASSRTEATQSFQDNANPAWNDLDANGNWYNVPGQGYVWSPYDASAAGWDPYGSGYWLSTPGFGYGWVSGYAWGYLPYTCGAWNYYNDFGWGWNPGLGACSPWWGNGIWAPNIGIGPIGYLPPRLPHRPPVRNPGRPGTHNEPYPLIAVNRRPAAGAAAQPARQRNVSATIAGHVVMPVRALSPRPVYDRSVSSFANRTASGAPAARTSEGMPGSAGGALYGGNHLPASAPRPVINSQHYSAPSHVSAPPPVVRAPSGGGGGGGAPHASGGGGGGGAAHH